MSVNYSAQIIVGLPRGEIGNQQLIHDDDLEVCPPGYDCGGDDDAIAGFSYVDSGDYSACEFVWNEDEIIALKQKFFETTGQYAKVYISPCSY